MLCQRASFAGAGLPVISRAGVEVIVQAGNRENVGRRRGHPGNGILGYKVFGWYRQRANIERFDETVIAPDEYKERHDGQGGNKGASGRTLPGNGDAAVGSPRL